MTLIEISKHRENNGKRGNQQTDASERTSEQTGRNKERQEKPRENDQTRLRTKFSDARMRGRFNDKFNLTYLPELRVHSCPHTKSQPTSHR